MHKTAYEVRISDWSSDVCSSDLADDATAFTTRAYGLELDSTLTFGMFNLAAIATIQDAKITENTADPSIVGNKVHRQPSFQLRVSPSIDFEVGEVDATDRKSTRLNSSH